MARYLKKDNEVEDTAATSTAPPARGVEGINQEQGETSM